MELSIVHVSDMGGGRAVPSNGRGDLPISAAALHGFPGAGAPAVAGALTVVLPTGNASCGLGSGQTALGLDIGLGASPDPKLHLSADASRSIGGISSQSTLSAPHATSVLLGGGYDVSQSWRADVSPGIDVRQSDSTHALSPGLGGAATRRFGALGVTA